MTQKALVDEKGLINYTPFSCDLPSPPERLICHHQWKTRGTQPRVEAFKAVIGVLKRIMLNVNCF